MFRCAMPRRRNQGQGTRSGQRHIPTPTWSDIYTAVVARRPKYERVLDYLTGVGLSITDSLSRDTDRCVNSL